MLAPAKNYPALLYTQKNHKTLIIADLHLGWEINLAQKGIYIPSQMQKILQKLLKLLDLTKPDTLIFLGDIKDTIAKAETGEWQDVPEFFEAITRKVSDVQIIRGNHDGNLEPLLPPTVKIHQSTGIVLDDTGLFHGHTWPAKNLLNCSTLAMGHVHPTAAFRDSLGFQITTPVWIKARCKTEEFAMAYQKSKHVKIAGNSSAIIRGHSNIKLKVKTLLIMPIFNDFLGGRPINKKREHSGYIGPLFRSKAVDIDKAEVYLLDGTFLGTVEQLKALV